LTNDSFGKLRNHIIENGKILSILNCSDHVFQDAVVPTICFSFQKNSAKTTDVFFYNIANDNKIYLENRIDTHFFHQQDKIFNIKLQNAENKLFEKVYADCLLLGEVLEIRESIKTGDDGAFFSTIKLNDNYFPVITGKDIARYHLDCKRFINYDSEQLDRPTKLEYYQQEKLFIRRVGNSLCATFDDENHLSTHVLYLGLSKNNDFELKYLLALLNSKLMNYVYNLKYPAKGTVFPEIRIGHLRELPIKNSSLKQQQPFIEKTDLMLVQTKEFADLNNKFLKFCDAQFSIPSINERLKKWYLFDFKEFTNELKKQKIKDLSKQYDFMEIYEREREKILKIKHTIDSCDSEIDAMVYNLYQLDCTDITTIKNGK